jgi:hypothetical protein
VAVEQAVPFLRDDFSTKITTKHWDVEEEEEQENVF